MEFKVGDKLVLSRLSGNAYTAIIKEITKAGNFKLSNGEIVDSKKMEVRGSYSEWYGATKAEPYTEEWDKKFKQAAKINSINRILNKVSEKSLLKTLSDEELDKFKLTLEILFNKEN